MNRFSKSKKDRSFLTRLILPLLAFTLVILLFIAMMSTTQANSVEQQYQALSRALRRNMIHTYATEGYYPPSLDYIKERYHFLYNTDLFYIDYQPSGQNMLPEVTIIRLQ